jgi:hypothetical protein
MSVLAKTVATYCRFLLVLVTDYSERIVHAKTHYLKTYVIYQLY